MAGDVFVDGLGSAATSTHSEDNGCSTRHGVTTGENTGARSGTLGRGDKATAAISVEAAGSAGNKRVRGGP